ncbi:hypothetical protein FCV66_19025 [Enterovibrio norvegicus]|uniref:hypothetical protein n=1 Tax=Enterovibrio norvegicus TaxID=188144 RepID=UPI0010BE24A4|nr:hypothetical protein [Enterovibrio norvegicus]TKF10785.1 hypothetical protein FCV66_19025 [Enterovibrio norvegicus]
MHLKKNINSENNENFHIHIDKYRGSLVGWVYFKNKSLSLYLIDKNGIEKKIIPDLYRDGVFKSYGEDARRCGFDFPISDGEYSIIVKGGDCYFGVYEFYNIKPILYIHIAKTAGSTINNHFKGHLKERAITHVESNPNWMVGIEDNQYDFISGHLTYNEFRNKLNLENYTTAITFRDPVKHLISHLCWIRFLAEPTQRARYLNHPEYIRNLADKLFKTDFKSNSSISLLIDSLNPQEVQLLDNTQTRYIRSKIRKPRVDISDIEDSVNNLSEINFVATEHNISSLIHELATSIGLSCDSNDRRDNVLSEKYGLDPSNSAQLLALEPLIKFDKVLYDLVKGILRFDNKDNDLFEKKSLLNKYSSLGVNCNTLYHNISTLSSNEDCDVSRFNDGDRNIVTLVSAVAENPIDSRGKVNSHFKFLIGNALSAAMSNTIKGVHVIFSREWVNTPIQDFTLYYRNFELALDRLEIPMEARSKLKFTVLNDYKELPILLRGTIIKMKSVAKNHSCYVFDKKIYENFPVLISSYNGEFSDSKNSDYLLVRHESKISDSSIIYYPPSFEKIIERDRDESFSSKVILTAYQGKRIGILLKTLDNNFWSKMEILFEKGFKWVLAGYKGFDTTEDLRRLIPGAVLERHCESIQLVDYLDLEEYCKDVYAMWFFSFFHGGGGTAKIAASRQVPIFVEKGKSIDVNCFLPTEQLFSSVDEKIEILISWDEDSKLRSDFIKRQTDFCRSKTNFLEHDSNLPKAIELAIERYNSRVSSI